MSTRIGINGFGRTGRQVFRAIWERQQEQLEVVAINDLTDAATNAHLLKYDSNYGRFPTEVAAGAKTIRINEHLVDILAERDPGAICW